MDFINTLLIFLIIIILINHLAKGEIFNILHKIFINYMKEEPKETYIVKKKKKKSKSKSKRMNKLFIRNDNLSETDDIVIPQIEFTET